MSALLPLAASAVGVAMLYVSWRSSRTWKWLALCAGLVLIGLSTLWWVRFGGVEFGVPYATIALAFAAWGVVIALGREARRPAERRPQTNVSSQRPGWSTTRHTLARAFVAIPLAGTASLLASIGLVAGLPWVTANRYVFAITVAPVIWGLLAMWAGMTARLSRMALLLTGVCVTCAAILFLR